MKDVFKTHGLRQASKGADDNASATATLMEAARVLSGMNLKRDVWLVHLTGEEFPADCLGARALSEALVTGKPVIPGKKNPKIVGLYVLDMIGHSVDRDKDAKAASVFQICHRPGRPRREARQAGARGDRSVEPVGSGLECEAGAQGGVGTDPIRLRRRAPPPDGAATGVSG